MAGKPDSAGVPNSPWEETVDLKKLVKGLLFGVGALLYIGGIWRQGWLALQSPPRW